MNGNAAKKAGTIRLSQKEQIARCIYLLERRVSNSTLFRKWDQIEIMSCLHEIKVSLKYGGNPKYSINMLLRYCSGFPLLRRLAKNISAFNDNQRASI